MEDKPFASPVVLSLPGGEVSVAGTQEAISVLLEGWPAEAGPRHRDALDTCYKVLDGHRSAVDAREALVEAAREAGITARG